MPSSCSVRYTDEKNDSMKSMIRKKADEYMDRAEKLKEHLVKAGERRSRSAVGANGAPNSGVGGTGRGDKGDGDDGDDPEVKKLRAGLSSAW
jgi:vacuolar protein-sorting-associated protein 4